MAGHSIGIFELAVCIALRSRSYDPRECL